MALDIAVIEETPAQRRARRIKKTLIHLTLALIMYGLVVLGARSLHRRVLYQPPEGDAPKLPEGAATMAARAADGVTVNALTFAPKATSGSTRTVVHFHGNAETAEDNATLGRELAKRGFAVVLVEYRGYGRSRGTQPTEQGLYADAAAILDELRAHGTGPDRVVLWGQSLGSGVAVEMARRGLGARLVLVAPLSSTLDLGARVAPFLPMSYVMVDRYDNLSKAPEVQQPTLVVHGDIDDVIPFELGERVSRALPHARLLKVPEGRHDNLYKNGSVLSALFEHAGGS